MYSELKRSIYMLKVPAPKHDSQTFVMWEQRMKQSLDPIPHHSSGSHSRRAERLRKRLREINARGEKELAAVLQNIERAKAAFRSRKQ